MSKKYKVTEIVKIDDSFIKKSSIDFISEIQENDSLIPKEAYFFEIMINGELMSYYNCSKDNLKSVRADLVNFWSSGESYLIINSQ